MRPMHATVAVITALAVWNDVMTPLVILAGSDQNTLPLAQLNFQTQFGTNYNLAFASYLLFYGNSISEGKWNLYIADSPHHLSDEGR